MQSSSPISSAATAVHAPPSPLTLLGAATYFLLLRRLHTFTPEDIHFLTRVLPPSLRWLAKPLAKLAGVHLPPSPNRIRNQRAGGTIAS